MPASKSFLLLSAVLILPGCGRGSGTGGGSIGSLPRRPNVILISIDTLNRNALRCYDPNSAPLPFLDGFAGECVRFTHAVAAAAWTLPSQASMLTGLYPNHHGTTDPKLKLAENVPTLASQLASSYETVAVTNSVYFDPAYGLNRGFGKYVCVTDPKDPTPEWIANQGDTVFDQAVKYISSRKDTSRPLFMFVQTFLVHNYYQEPLDPGEAAGDKHIFQRNLNWVTGSDPCPPEALPKLEAAYSRRVARMDRSLEAFATALKHAGLWDSSVIVFTSDHGEGFDLELGRMHHGGLLYSNVIRVPLMIRAPGLAPREEAASVSLIDVMPSLLDVTGTEAPGGVDGRSFLGLLSPQPGAWPPRTLFAMEHAFWWNKAQRVAVKKLQPMPLSVAAIRGNRWCIRGGRSGEGANLGPGGVEELYDMENDPDQRRPLLMENNPLSLEQSAVSGLGDPARTNLRGNNKELDDQLKRLGYTR